jgi:hypothetical protein
MPVPSFKSAQPLSVDKLFDYAQKLLGTAALGIGVVKGFNEMKKSSRRKK